MVKLDEFFSLSHLIGNCLKERVVMRFSNGENFLPRKRHWKVKFLVKKASFPINLIFKFNLKSLNYAYLREFSLQPFVGHIIKKKLK